MNRVSKLVIMAGFGLATASLASAALPPMFLFGPPRNVIIPPVGPWIPAQPTDNDIYVPPPVPGTPIAVIRAPAPPPDPLPYPGPGQPEES